MVGNSPAAYPTGRSGPYRDFKANGATTETIAGWVSLFGYPGEPPANMGEMEADPICGLQLAALSLTALALRDRTGAGQQIDGSMFEAAAGYIGEEILFSQFSGAEEHPRGNRDRAMAPQGVFPCLGEDQWVAISVRDDDDWRALLGVIRQAPHLYDARFSSAAGRCAHVDEIEQQISEWARSREPAAVMAALQQAGVPAGTVLKTDDVLKNQHFQAREWFRPLAHADTGTQQHAGYPWRFSRSPLVWSRPPPRLGEHSKEILCRELGVSPEEYALLLETGEAACVLDQPAPQMTPQRSPESPRLSRSPLRLPFPRREGSGS
jgi:crotonobetainyl-CoA:carnitine CoA-transferase CaiB-like acyl-CoA transferase